jgi:hypothetical protein
MMRFKLINVTHILPVNDKCINTIVIDQLFCASSASFLSNPRRIHSGKKDRERGKEKGSERGIWVVLRN